MAWTTPRTWVLGELVTETLLNTHLRDNLKAIYPDYGTSLPGSPYNDKQAILVDSTTAPTYRWHLRYNSSISGNYKWEFLGGTAYKTSPIVLQFTNSAAYAVSSAVSLTVPVAGIYELTLCGRNHTATGNTTYWTYAVNDTSAGDGAAAIQATQSTTVWFQREVTLSAADVLEFAYRASGTGSTHTLNDAQLMLSPVRIG